MPQGFFLPQKTDWKKLLLLGDGKTEATLGIFESPREQGWNTLVSRDAAARKTSGNVFLRAIRAMFVTLYSSLGSNFSLYSVKDKQHRNCGTCSSRFPVRLHITALILEQDSSLGEHQT